MRAREINSVTREDNSTPYMPGRLNELQTAHSQDKRLFFSEVPAQRGSACTSFFSGGMMIGNACMQENEKIPPNVTFPGQRGKEC